MKAAHTQNNFLAYLLILGALFVLIFFTRGIFSNMQIALDEREQKSITKEQKKQEASNLDQLKNQLAEEGSSSLEDIQGFTGDFSPQDILEYLHEYAGQVNAGNERIIMRDIDIIWDIQSDIGFNKATINISAVVSSESTLFSFLNFLTGAEGRYRFFISQFNYPMNEGTWNIQANIPLTLYYK